MQNYSFFSRRLRRLHRFFYYLCKNLNHEKAIINHYCSNYDIKQLLQQDRKIRCYYEYYNGRPADAPQRA